MPIAFRRAIKDFTRDHPEHPPPKASLSVQSNLIVDVNQTRCMCDTARYLTNLPCLDIAGSCAHASVTSCPCSEVRRSNLEQVGTVFVVEYVVFMGSIQRQTSPFSDSAFNNPRLNGLLSRRVAPPGHNRLQDNHISKQGKTMPAIGTFISEAAIIGFFTACSKLGIAESSRSLQRKGCYSILSKQMLTLHKLSRSVSGG